MPNPTLDPSDKTAPDAAAAAAPRQGERMDALRALSEITTRLATEQDPEKLLARALGTLVQLAGANAGMVRVVTADGEHLRLVSAQGLPDEVVEREQLVPLSCHVCGLAVRDNAVRQVFDLKPCANTTGLPYFDECRTMAVVPLQYQGKALGAYNLFFAEPREIKEEVALLFRSISEHLGLALENARLTRENMRMTLMNERQLIANEVHDSLAQTLAYMNLRLTLLQDALQEAETANAAKYAADVQQAVELAYADLRELLAQFRSRMNPLGLAHALKELADGFYDRSGITLDFQNRIAGLDLTVDQEVQAYRIVQEALANVARHSGAKHARLIMELRDGQYQFTIEDDGMGFFTLGQRVGRRDEAQRPRHHLGLSIMRERAQQLNGTIEIANLPEGGARVRLSFPEAISGAEPA
jgi:two-component system, NarL family, nitrate/nitrite sensor histidine kinase NarX